MDFFIEVKAAATDLGMSVRFLEPGTSKRAEERLFLGARRGGAVPGSDARRLSLVTFIPGAWSTTVLWGAFRRWPHYRYQQVPSWDDGELL